MKPSLAQRVDHLLYATPNVDETVADLERRLGVRASEGGQHLGRGTRNALIALGPRCYLEIIGPDPAQPRPTHARWLGIDDLSHARLVAWAANVSDMEAAVAECAQLGVQFGAIATGSRRQRNGDTLYWTFTDPTTVIEGGVVPFLIDWTGSAHPAATTPARATLVEFTAEHPQPDVVRPILRALEIELDVAPGPEFALVAVLRAGDVDVELR